MDDLTQIPQALFGGDKGAIALLTFTVILIFMGKLRPERYVREVREDRDARVLELKETIELWKEAYQTSESARSEMGGSLDQLLELAKTNEALIRALRKDTGDGST